MIRAADAKPGDRTYDGATVESVSPIIGGNLTLLVVRGDDGKTYDQVWRSDDPVDQ